MDIGFVTESRYPVSCDCGHIHWVPAGGAGSVLACGCGRQVRIPSLSVLRRQAGEPTTSVELRIDMMLRQGQLPEGGVCLRCGALTSKVCHAVVICERPDGGRLVEGLHLLGLLLHLLHPIGILFSLFLSLHSGSVGDQPAGRIVRFRLPLPVCPDCSRNIRKSALVKALRQVRLYAALLEKYPHAKVSLERGG